MFNAEIGFRPKMFLNQHVEAMSQMFLGYLSINDRLLKSKLPSDLTPSVSVGRNYLEPMFVKIRTIFPITSCCQEDR